MSPEAPFPSLGPRAPAIKPSRVLPVCSITSTSHSLFTLIPTGEGSKTQRGGRFA